MSADPTGRRDLYEGREPRRFEQVHVVAESDTDAMGHVNNVVYVDWIQQVAGAHWRHAADPDVAARIAWVLTRHEIDYKRAAHPGDELTVRTWVGTATPVRFERHVEIVDREERLVVRSRSVWSPVDRGSGKLVRLDTSAHEPFYD